MSILPESNFNDNITGTTTTTTTITDETTTTDVTTITDASGNITINAADAINAGKGKVDLTQVTGQPIDTVEESSPLKLDMPDADYLVNFCKTRYYPEFLKKIKWFEFPQEEWSKYIGIAAVGGLLLFFLGWWLVNYYDIIFPFAKGSINILKYIIIYCVIIFVLIQFFKFTKTFSWWYDLFIKYLKLTINPLIDDKVSYWYCYFTGYVNWLIYYPAMIYFLICLIGISAIFFLIIIPIIVAISFVIGYLFSLLGDDTNIGNLLYKMKKTAGTLGSRMIGKTRAPEGGVSKPLNVMSFINPDRMNQMSAVTPNLMKQASSFINPEMIKKASSMVSPDMMKQASSMVSPDMMKQAASMMSAFK